MIDEALVPFCQGTLTPARRALVLLVACAWVVAARVEGCCA